MSLFTIENCVVAILALSLAGVIFRYAQNTTHRLWGFFNLVISIWALGMFCVGVSQSETQSIFFWKFSFIAVPFIGVVYYHFVCSYCKINRSTILKFIYPYAISFAVLSVFTNKVICNVPLIFNSIYYNQVGLISYFSFFFAVWVVIVLSAFFEFFIYLKSTSGLLRIQSLFMFWSMVVGFTGGVSTVLPSYGLKFYPGLQLLIIFYIFFTSYAIFKHGLIPLDVVIKRSLVYSSLATSITIIYLISILIFERIFNQFIVYRNLAGSLVPLIVIAIIFIPLKNWIQSIVDKMILKNSPVEIAVQNENLRNEVAKTEKLRSIANLASMLAHEIKNPLTALSTFTEQLRERKDEPGFIDEFEAVVTKEIERINSLLNELLLLAKPSEPQIKDINPNEIIEQIIKLVQAKCDNLNIAIICKFEAKTKIPADFNLIKQSLLNLVLNAIDSMQNGGTLSISTSIQKADNSKDLYIINVLDTGCGINSKDLPYVFEPFFTRKANGTGLGLPITQSIIEKHGGKIEVNSRINVGTFFKIILSSN